MKLKVEMEQPEPSTLKKWLDVPADKLKELVQQTIDNFWTVEVFMEKAEAIAHVTFEKNPEQ